MKNIGPFSVGNHLKLYAPTSVCDWLSKLNDEGYDCVQLDGGGCGCGNWFCISPDDEKYYHFVIQEVYLNEWSSGQTIRRRSTISKEMQKRIDLARNEEEGM